MRKSVQGSMLFLLAGIAHSAAAAPASYVIANNTPRFVASAQKTSTAIDPSEIIEVTVWLNPHNRAALDLTVGRLYDRTSPLYHRWLTREALGRMLAPSDGEAADVRKFLEANNLSIVSRDKYNFFLRARGSVAAVQKAFNVTLANLSFGGRTLRTNLADPTIADPAGAHVMAIEGLDSVTFEHHNIAQAAAIKGLKLPAASAAAQAATQGSAKSCITGTGTETFNTSGAPPSATYSGNFYSASPIGCGYTPAQIQAAYGLNALYTKGYDGTGQTIVIVDWCGSPTITGDANAFSKKYGLPALTSNNFAIVDYPAPSTCAAPDVEINIDVEWAHAIAPGANILLLVPPSATFQDIDSGLTYIVENDVGNVVSNSYGSEELYTSSAVLELQNFIMETAASVGIAMNFSSGDDGDFTFDYPQYNPASVSAPADSPYATAVGGVSLELSSANAIQFQAPWGTNETGLADAGFVPVPGENFGFVFGSGGGPSAVFPKLPYQSKLSGKFRKVPDISWLADPFTGGIIAISEPFTSATPVYEVYGGTSLACPMFSALWAIADQVAGASLGQAAPMLYAAPAAVIADVLPVGSTTNVTASYVPATGKPFKETAAALAAPLEGNKTFLSALWNYPDEQDTAYLITFGTDSALKAAPGWDGATGLGVTNPGALITYVTPAASAVKP
jgi:subtilase family serine protease